MQRNFNKTFNIYEKDFFALVALVIAVVFSACDKQDNLKQCCISVTEVTSNSIAFRCEYAPSKGDLGYNLFLTLTDEISEDMRNYILATYNEAGTLNKSVTFTCNDLISNQKYCILAVTYHEVNGKVTINSIESVNQSTLAENDNNVTVSDITAKSANFTLFADPKGYTQNYIRIYREDKSESAYYAKIELTAYESADKLEEEDCFNNNYLKCSVYWGEIVSGDPKSYTFYGAQPDSDTKFKAVIYIDYISDKDIEALLMP